VIRPGGVDECRRVHITVASYSMFTCEHKSDQGKEPVLRNHRRLYSLPDTLPGTKDEKQKVENCDGNPTPEPCLAVIPGSRDLPTRDCIVFVRLLVRLLEDRSSV